MKTKILLLVIIIGMVGIDIACNRGGYTCDETRFDIVRIDTIFLLEKNSYDRYRYKGITKDSIKFDSLYYGVYFEGREMAINGGFYFINGAFAAGCPPSIMDWDLDSIKIFAIDSNSKTEVTDQFSISGEFGKSSKIDNSNPLFFKNLLSSYSSLSLRLYFYLNTPPAKTDTYQFNFQFFDKKGRMFEKMSEPVVIAP